MNTTDQFELDLRVMLADRAPRREPEMLFEAVMTGTTAVRQRPGLLVGLRSGDVGTSPRTRFRLAPALLTGLLVVALAATLAIVGSRLLERQPSIPEFRATGSMTVPRTEATAVRLKDGRVLVLGGFDFIDRAAVLATAEIYDPASGRFEPTGSMAAARTRASATLLSDGRVLVAGGYPFAGLSGGGPPDAIASAEVYDPASGTFTPAGPMREARAEHGAVLLPSGEVLVVGGVGGASRTGNSATVVTRSTFERFDPATGRFTLVTGTLDRPISQPSLVLLADGRLLVADDGSFSVSIYDPTSGAVMARGQTSLRPGSAVGLPDGRVLLLSSQNDSADGRSQLYDPTTGALGPLVPVEHRPDENGPERVVVADGGGPVIRFATSYVEVDGSPVWAAIAETLDPATGSATAIDVGVWEPYDGFSVTPLSDGTILVAGGSLWVIGDGSFSASSSAALLVP